MTTPAEPLVRIVGGELNEDGLAALTAVLLARAAAAQEAATRLFGHGHHHPRACWHRLERVGGYRSPLSWR